MEHWKPNTIPIDKTNENIDEIACGPGWNKALLNFFEQVKVLNDSLKGHIIHAVQIKEKWGRLRVYALVEPKPDIESNEDPQKIIAEFQELLKHCKKETDSTCERCGCSDKPLYTTKGWIKYVCEECLHKI